MRILVVEDEPDLRTLIEYNLQQAGFGTEGVGSGMAAQRAIAKAVPDLVILDLMLPDLPGTEVCRELRRNERTRAIPVLILTAKAEESQRIYGLEIGADDYMVKPASMRELVLRVNAILRRADSATAPSAAVAERDSREVLQAPGIALDVAERRATVDGASVDLTDLETRLLETLMARAGRVQSRETLLERVWPGEELSPRTVDMRVKRLRTRLGRAGRYIEAVRGIGYRFGSGED